MNDVLFDVGIVIFVVCAVAFTVYTGNVYAMHYTAVHKRVGGDDMNFEVDTEAMLMEYPQDQEENEYRFIDAEWLDRVAAGLTAGAVKHPGETWKSIPPEEHAARAIRHLNMFRKGDRSEDHLINASMRCMMASVLAMEEAAGAAAPEPKKREEDFTRCPRCGSSKSEKPVGLKNVLRCTSCKTCWIVADLSKVEAGAVQYEYEDD